MKSLALILFVGLVLAVPVAAWSDSMETNNTPPAAVISPWTYWPNSPTSGRFYRPTGIQVGSTFYMYVEGGAYTNTPTGPGSETCPASGEKILAFSTPWTAQGLRSQFSYVGVVSPCINAPQLHFITGSAFQSSTDGRVKLLIDVTEGGSNVMHGDFKETLLGSSTDGVNFSWSTFLKQSKVGGLTYSPYLVKLVQAKLNSNWWGTFWWADCMKCDGVTPNDGLVTEPGRIKVVMDPTNVRGFVVYLLALDGTWKQVNDDGTFNFDLGVANSDILTSSIVFNNGAWEEWGDTGLDPATQGCYVGTPGSSTFQYQFTNPAAAFGSIQHVTSAVRPMPTRNGGGRLGPFRMQDMNGARLLYSSSTDRLCALGIDDGFGGSEIIVTEVNN